MCCSLCCSESLCVAVRCCALLCVAVIRGLKSSLTILQCAAVGCSVLQLVLQAATESCSELLRVAVCCSVLQCVPVIPGLSSGDIQYDSDITCILKTNVQHRIWMSILRLTPLWYTSDISHIYYAYAYTIKYDIYDMSHILYRVAYNHRMPYLYRSFSEKEPYI